MLRRLFKTVFVVLVILAIYSVASAPAASALSDVAGSNSFRRTVTLGQFTVHNNDAPETQKGWCTYDVDGVYQPWTLNDFKNSGYLILEFESAPKGALNFYWRGDRLGWAKTELVPESGSDQTTFIVDMTRISAYDIYQACDRLDIFLGYYNNNWADLVIKDAYFAEAAENQQNIATETEKRDSVSSVEVLPEDALSARPAESVYTAARVDDLSGLLREIFSPAHTELATPLLGEEQAQIMSVVAGVATQTPAKSIAVALGMAADMEPFAQVAVSMPDSVRPQLDRVADGSATPVDIVTLLLGDAGMMFAATVAPEVHKGDKGTYYTLEGIVAFTARDNLLLIASSPAELEASIGALEKQENRLALKRRFDSPNYWRMHLNALTAAAIVGEDGYDELLKAFKAPLEIEIGFESKPGSYLLSSAVNILEALADASGLVDKEPESGGGLFMAGGGKLLLALSSRLAFSADAFKAYPG
ncbi:MAG: hypothetical protein FWG71_09915, partial [Synergistaceae bacterium]|nr:hypothetical protein [Synergistaceae bacterium]